MAVDGYLVAPEWAKKVDETVKRFDAAQLATSRDVGGVFYDLRPAVLASAWSQNGAGLYVATANFIVNDSVDSSFTFPIYAPTAGADPGGTVGTTRFFVVWRGRWELVAGAGAPSLTLLNTSFNVPNGFGKDSGGYLTIETWVKTLKYYGES